MEISITLPEQLANTLQLKKETFSNQLLESFAAEQYRLRLFTALQVGQLLGHSSWWETEEFLKKRQCFHPYDDHELELEMNPPSDFFR